MRGRFTPRRPCLIMQMPVNALTLICVFKNVLTINEFRRCVAFSLYSRSSSQSAPSLQARHVAVYVSW